MKIKSKICVLLVMICMLCLIGCGAESQETTTQENTTQEPATEQPTLLPEEDLIKLVEDKLSSMTLHEKICQMFVVTPEDLTGIGKVTAAGETTKKCLEEYPVGGLVYFAYNLVSPEQTIKMIGNVQSYSNEIIGLPLFTCIDEEGGRVARIGNNDTFSEKKISYMSDVKSEAEAYNIGSTIGMYLRKYGFNVDFAPVADVITNEKNNVIGNRSFGTDKDIVAKYAAAVSDGLHSAGILSTFKHFPGHGATEGDTHEGFAYTNKTYEEMKINEFVPFMLAKEKGVDMIMVAHISVPNIIGGNTPCSLSYKMITDILKGELGYDGLVITDALGMGAIANAYTGKEAVVMAVKAGNDILLMPQDLRESVEAIKEAVNKGEISIERIDESVRKILMKKFNIK